MVRRSARIAGITTEAGSEVAPKKSAIEGSTGEFQRRKSSRVLGQKKANEAAKAMQEREKESEPQRNGLRLTKEQRLWKKGLKMIAGVDEAGRGPLAGPVVAAAVVVDASVDIEGIDDSKKLCLEDRERLYDEIVNHPQIKHSICEISPKEIDDINILQATMVAMTRAVLGLKVKGSIDYAVVDGNRYPKALAEAVPGEAVVKGDQKVFSIACASILAKVYRDRIMTEADKKWPVYGFKDHKGYPTAMHRQMVAIHGVCDIHRRTFKQCRMAIENEGKENVQEEGN